MLAIHKITGKLGELEKAVDEAVSGTHIPTDKKIRITCFAPIFKEFQFAFDSDPTLSGQQFHFAAIYGLIKIHAKQIEELLVPDAIMDASKQYHAVLLNFLKEHEQDFQSYRRSIDAKKYIIYNEAPFGTTYNPEHHQGFAFGAEMAHEKSESVSNAPATSFPQLEKRIFAIAYFDMYQREIEMTLTNRTRAAVASSLAVAVFAPLALPLTVGAGVAHYTGYLGREANAMKVALEGSVIRRYEISKWNTQTKALLTNTAKSKATLRLFQPSAATEGNHSKKRFGLF